MVSVSSQEDEPGTAFRNQPKACGILTSVTGGKLNKVGGILEMGRILKVRGALHFEVIEDGEKEDISAKKC